MAVVIEEQHSGKGIINSVYRLSKQAGLTKIYDPITKTASNGVSFSSWIFNNQMFKEIFLPRGYPDSVSSDYLEYQIWDSLQAFGSSITGTLATHNVLKGIGVGDQSASLMSATFTWLLRDGTGMIGRIAFTYFKGSNLDVDCKKWRLFADVINDFAIGLDMICPLFPNSLLLLQCSSGFVKSLVGTIGGATRAALTQHQARNNNLADVSAKDASQETLVNLAALLTSLLLVPVITESNVLIWIMFVLLTISHIYCNYRAVKSVKMEIFNPSRWTSFIKQYMFKLQTGSIGEVNQLETIWFFSKHQFHDKIHSGLPLSAHKLTDEQLTDVIKNWQSQEYILSVNSRNHVLISFIDGQDSVRNQLKAYFHSNIILFLLYDQKAVDFLQSTGQIEEHRLLTESIVEVSESLADKRFDRMVIDAEFAGWNLSNFIFLENGWRIKLKNLEKKSN